MKLHLPSRFRRYFMACLFAGVSAYPAYSTYSDGAVFASDAELSGSYEKGIYAYGACELIINGSVHALGFNIHDDCILRNNGSLYLTGGISYFSENAIIDNNGNLYADNGGVYAINFTTLFTNSGYYRGDWLKALQLKNTGTIKAKEIRSQGGFFNSGVVNQHETCLESDDSSASSVGVISEKITNTQGGEINVDILSEVEERVAYGVIISINDTAFLDNSGKIDIIAKGRYKVYGIDAGGRCDYVKNTTSGNIQIDVTSENSNAYGFYHHTATANPSYYAALDNYGIFDAKVNACEDACGIYARYNEYVNNHEGAQIELEVQGKNAYGIYLDNSAKGIYNSGLLDICAQGENVYGVYFYSSPHFINNGTVKISVNSEGANGIAYGIDTQWEKSQIINWGSIEIDTKGTGEVIGIHLGYDTQFYNAGTLKTDSILGTNSNSYVKLLNASSTGAYTEQKALSISGSTNENARLYLGGALGEDYAISAVEGGSRVNISSALELSALYLNLQDDVTLAMGGDLTIGGSVSTTRNGHRLMIDNGAAAHTVTYGSAFSASWDHTLELTADGVAWDSSQDTPSNLTLKSGTLNVYGTGDADYKAPDITLESGTLNICADSSSSVTFSDTSFTWKTTDGTTPLLSININPVTQVTEQSYALSAAPRGIVIDVETTQLNVSGEAKGQKLLDVGVSASNLAQVHFTKKQTGYGWSSVYDTANGLYNYYGYQQWVDNNSSSDHFSTSSGQGVVIYKNDLYYSSQATHRQSKLDSTEQTWRGGDFVVYDAEKLSKNNPKVDALQYDNEYCQLAVALNMATYWLDKYAVLNTSVSSLPTVGAQAPSSSALNDKRSSLSADSLYDLYSRAWEIGGDKNTHNQHTAPALGWILSGSSLGKYESEEMKKFYQGAAPFGGMWTTASHHFEDLENGDLPSIESGKIYTLFTANNDGVISDAGKLLTLAIDKAFSYSEAPVSIGWHSVVSGTSGTGTGEYTNHVVTCWGYELSDVDGKTVVSRLWYTDSDDKNLMSGGDVLRSYAVVYGDDGRAYLVDTEKGASMGPDSGYLTDITFMTTPDGMDSMLKDYYDKTKPIYWTGTNSEWKKDDLGGYKAQDRLATISDGWRKECVGGGRSIWAYTTFSGSKEDVIFGEAVDGVKVANKKIAIADDVDAGRVTVADAGYEWYAKEGEKSVVAKSLTLNEDASLSIASNVNLTTTDSHVYLASGSTLNNAGLIDGIVYMEAGSTFHSGCIAVSQGQDPSSTVNIALGDGLYAHVADRGLSEGSRVVFMEEGSLLNSYTLGTTIDFGGASVSRNMYDEVIDTYRVIFEELAASGIFAHDHSVEHINYVFTTINGKMEDSAANMLATSTSIDGNEVVVSGSAAQALTVGSFSVARGESAANILFAEQLAGKVVAREADLCTIAGDSTYINTDSRVEARSLLVEAGSELENDGVVKGAVEVEGTLSGSGSFGAVTAHEGSSVIVGNSPGAAEYESLVLESGAELVFSVDGLTPAAEGSSGWGSGTHSVLTFTTPDGLTLDAGAEVKIAFSSEFLASAAIGESLTLTLFRGIEADEALLATLREATGFYYAALDDTLSGLEESTLYSVHAFDWVAGADESIGLNITLYYAGQGAVARIPEPATASLSLLALTALAARRRRR